MVNKTIVRIVHGSQLYGTNIPSSDLDLKGVFFPTFREMALNPKRSVKRNVKGTARIQPGELDMELFELGKFIALALDSQTMALEMLWAPADKVLETSQHWEYLVGTREEFLSRGMESIAGYCKSQANKYCVKGARFDAIVEAISFLTEFDGEMRINEFASDPANLEQMADVTEPYFDIVDMSHGDGRFQDKAIVISSRYLPFSTTVEYSLGVLRSVEKAYGKRTRASAGGQDWKALMHAYRVADQGIELANTANLTLPRPNAELLLQIRKGELPFDEVAEMIDERLSELEYAMTASSLPASPNRQDIFDRAESMYLEHFRGMLK